MFTWQPKTSVTGGLLNIMFEPRKLKLLGTMIRNGVEVMSSIIVNQGIVQGEDAQAFKRWVRDSSSLPQGK